MKKKFEKLLTKIIDWLESKQDYYAGIPTVVNGKLTYKHGWAIRRGAKIISLSDRAGESIVFPPQIDK